MSLLDDARDDLRAGPSPDTDADEPQAGTAKARMAHREATVSVAGESITVDDPETIQTGDSGNWLASSSKYGRPRGADALENRQIVQTSAMQSIVNGVVDQLLGGDLAFEADDDVMDSLGSAGQDAAADLRALLRDVLTGPHLADESLDDLVTAAVEDMMGPGQAYWQLLGPEGDGPPVVALTSLDPLTIRHAIDKHGVPGDPPYWQARNMVSDGGLSGMGAIEPVPLQADDLAVLSYPKGNRSYRFYPISPAWQVKEWLEILANSTTHHNRFYSDNEIPPGLLQIVNASNNTVEDVREKIEQASGDPRDVPIIGGEGGAQWLDMGGTAVNLNVIEEQKWFYYLCLGSLGLGKSEVGLIEDVNRSNGEIEATRIYKRVTGPFINQFEQAFRHIARQFDAYTSLGEPFTPTLAFTDPREERARSERLRQEYIDGVITFNQAARRRGDEDLAEMDTTVEIGGEVIDYGDKPLWVAKRLLSAAAGEGVDVDGDGDDDEEDDEEQTLSLTPGEPTPRHNGSS